MSSTITHTQTRSIVSNKYRVLDTATASVNIPLEPFVFTTSDASYNRIASVDDMLNLPNSRATAQSTGKEYYRQASVTIDWDLLAEADDFATTIEVRLKQLVIEYAAVVTDFIGTATTTVSS